MGKSLNLSDIEYICNVFFQSFNIPVYFLDNDKNMLLEFTANHFFNPFYSSKEEQLHSLFQENDPNDFLIFRITQYLEYFILIHIKSSNRANGTIIIGPVAYGDFSKKTINRIMRDLHLIANQEELNKYYLSLPIKDAWVIMNMGLLLYYMIYQKKLDINTYLQKDKSYIDTKKNIDNMDLYISMRRKAESIEYDLSFEQNLFGAVKAGDREAVIKHYYAYPQKEIGLLSLTSQLRHEKNIGIAVITLATRYAVQGGLSTEVAYVLSDFYIQTIEELNDTRAIIRFVGEALCTFADYVKKHKEQQYSKAIVMCQNYIFKNIYQEISVKQLATFVCMNPNYLSILFKKEVGIPLSEYIQREKVEEAKKLLTLTTSSVSDICTWLNFSDQSYFTKIFKKITGYTPKQYRGQHTILLG
ncbi:helix-turn-helix domain-containing protein [Microbacteriaceae bacterium 4G12]